MSIKNRSTLKQQYDDYIDRVAPFDGNALIQKTEDKQVTNDDFDSNLMKDDDESAINSPNSAIALDFESVDLYKINSSGSIDTAFDLTINNLGTGQVARIHITKKNNDTYSFTNAVIGQINNLKQTGTILSFFVHNINGVLVAYSDMTVAKTNSITDSDPEKIATAKAVNDLNTALTAVDNGLQIDIDTRIIDEANSVAASNIQAPVTFTVSDTSTFMASQGGRITAAGAVQLVGTYNVPAGPSLPLVLGTIASSVNRPNESVFQVCYSSGASESLVRVDPDGTINMLTGSTSTTYNVTNITYVV